MQTYKVTSSEVKKTGVRTTKNGKQMPWTLYVLTVEGSDLKPSGFDKVEAGDYVTIKETQNGDYTNYNYSKVDSENQPAAVSTGGGSDPRAVKLLVLIAEQLDKITDQVGAEKIITKEKLLDVLQG